MKKVTAFIFIVSVMFSAILQAQNVLAVLPSDNPLYKKVLEGFKSGSGAKVTEYIMEESAIPADRIAGADVIFVLGDKALKAAKTSGKPVVYCMAFISQANHDKRTSGVTLEIAPETKLNRIKEFLPAVKNIGVVYSADSKSEFDSLTAKGAGMGITVKGAAVAAGSDFNAAYASIRSGLNVFIMTADSKVYSPAVVKDLIEKGISDKLPVVGISSIYAKAGALMAFDYDYSDLGYQAGLMAASGKVGAFEYPRKVVVVINADTASAINAPLAPDALSKADQTIKK
jgi:ABC-type uncharacterized transport system substrate-binding protein